ncbi:non-structural maintenance of chromosomes element 1 homolog [Cylas formicarius]|uniref:non-structural maintenance of chromosomes element 1 homolog n=1 Tax=Cylas formicarius TaxID=197179 RepID=UPI002958413E|nr:non-structural maintenance of chromosomes element 1 homolog [Cylas formicarius]
MERHHRYLVQYMLKNGIKPIKKVLKYCTLVSEGAVQDVNQLKLMILDINREISKQNFKLVLGRCEVTDENIVMWLNTKDDNISKFQISFSALEMEYFNVLLKEIINSQSHKLTYATVLNITSTLSTHLSRDNGQTVFTKWLKGGYFVKIDDYVYLGPRTIFEFTSFLKSHCPEQICNLCLELVFTGTKCGSCERPFHSHCLQKYLNNQTNCPCCKNMWNELRNGNCDQMLLMDNDPVI